MKKLFLTVMFVSLASVALAAERSFFSPLSSDAEFVKFVKSYTDQNTSQLKDEAGQPFAPQSTTEVSNGVVPYAQFQRVVDLGILDAYAEWCGRPKDKQDMFDTVMKQEEQKNTWTKRQFLYMSLADGIANGLMTSKFQQDGGSCTEATRQDVQNFIQNLRTRN